MAKYHSLLSFFYVCYVVNRLLTKYLSKDFNRFFPLRKRIMYVRELSGMRESIEIFANEVGGKAHILQLIKKLDLCLKLESEKEEVILLFNGGRVELLTGNLNSQYQITIKGSEDSLAGLLKGEFKLRQGLRWGYYTVEDCPFRDLLVLESIFYLARPISA
jgi:hypothetical protein